MLDRLAGNHWSGAGERLPPALGDKTGIEVPVSEEIAASPDADRNSRPVPRCARRQSGAPPGKRRPGERKNEILDATVRAIARKGVSFTSIDDVAREAGLAKGSVYHYYGSRDALLTALLEHRGAPSRRRRCLNAIGGDGNSNLRFAHDIFISPIAGLDFTSSKELLFYACGHGDIAAPYLALVEEFLGNSLSERQRGAKDLQLAAQFVFGGACKLLQSQSSVGIPEDEIGERIAQQVAAFIAAMAN